MPRLEALQRRYGTREQLFRAFNPDVQVKVAENIRYALLGDYPTLRDLKAYGENTPVAWVVIQLNDLSEFCGCKKKLEGNPLRQCATTIAAMYGKMKLTELMLFFMRFKAGRYEKFYSEIDPLVITRSLGYFLKEIKAESDAHLAALAKERNDADLKNSIYRNEYEQLKKQQYE